MWGNKHGDRFIDSEAAVAIRATIGGLTAAVAAIPSPDAAAVSGVMTGAGHASQRKVQPIGEQTAGENLARSSRCCEMVISVSKPTSCED